tara:strand:- start:887 stop:1096 length:210 start_codon:yes stop_codon:yes gene_type:complete
MAYDRELMKEAMIKHAEGHIAKHKANIEVYFHNAAGVGEHPDILEAIEKELNIVAEYDDQIEMLNKYFG